MTQVAASVRTRARAARIRAGDWIFKPTCWCALFRRHPHLGGLHTSGNNDHTGRRFPPFLFSTCLLLCRHRVVRILRARDAKTSATTMLHYRRDCIQARFFLPSTVERGGSRVWKAPFANFLHCIPRFIMDQTSLFFTDIFLWFFLCR